jgi:hypothetical protein
MATFQPAPDCVQVTVEGSLDGQLTINDLFFRSSIGPRTPADVLALTAAIRDWYETSIAVMLNHNWEGRVVKGKGLSSPNPITALVSMTGVVGGETGDQLPNNCSMAVHFGTGLAGRSFSGRNYVPVLDRDDVVGNFIDSTWATAIVGGYQQLLFPSVVVPDGWIWVVISRVQGGVRPAEALFHEILSVSVVDLVVDSQRRRLPGRGA